MSLLYTWLNQELHFSPVVTPDNIDTLFRTGFYFGTIFSNLGFTATPTPFIKSSTAQAIVKNFVAVESLAREMLALRITVGDAIEVIDGVKGSAIKLIYQIRSCYLAVKNGTSIAGRIPFLMKDLGKKAFIAQDIQHFETILCTKFKKISISPARLPVIASPAAIKEQTSFQPTTPKQKLQPIRNSPIAITEVEPTIEPLIYEDGKAKRKAHFLHEKLYLSRHDLRLAKFMKQRCDKLHKISTESFEARIETEAQRMPIAEKKLKKMLTKNYQEKRQIISNRVEYDDNIARAIQAREAHDAESFAALKLSTENDIALQVAIEKSKLKVIQDGRLNQVSRENRRMAQMLAGQLFELSWKNIEYKRMHSLSAPPERCTINWTKNFVAGHHLEDVNDFLDANPDASAVQDMNYRDMKEYLAVKESILSPKMNELLAAMFAAAIEQNEDKYQADGRCTLKPISCILGNKLVFEKKYFDKLGLNSGCMLYDLDEVVHNWIPVPGKILDKICMGLELADEDIVDIIIAEIVKNDSKVTSHLLINFPRNEVQSILFEQKLSGFAEAFSSMPGDLTRFDDFSHVPAHNVSLLSTATMSSPKCKHDTALSSMFIPEVPIQTLLVDQVTKHTMAVLNCTPLDPLEESTTAQLYHLCFEGESIKQVETFYSVNAFTTILRFDAATVKGSLHDYINKTLVKFPRSKKSVTISMHDTSERSNPSIALFCNYWVAIEKVFTDRLRFLFRKLRQELEEIETFIFGIKYRFIGNIEKPCDIFNRFDTLVAEYNNADCEIKAETEFKSEFQLRIFEIADFIGKFNVTSYQDSDLLLQKFVNEKFVDEKMLSIATIYAQIIRAEADKHVHMLKLVNDYYRDQSDKPLDAAQFDNITLPSLKMSPELIIGKVWKKDKDPAQKIDLQTAASKMKVTYTYIDKAAGALGTQRSGKEVELYTDDLQQQIDILIKAFSIQSENSAGKSDSKKKTIDVMENPTQMIIIEQEGFLLKDRLKNLKNSYSETFKNEYLSMMLTLDDINTTNFGIRTTMVQTYSMVLKECIESGINVPNNFVFQNYQVKLCYNVHTIPSEERPASEAVDQAKEILESNADDLAYLKESFEYHAYREMIIKDVMTQGVQRCAKIFDHVQLTRTAIVETPVNWETYLDGAMLENKCRLPE